MNFLRQYQIIFDSAVNDLLKHWVVTSAGSKEIYNQRYGRYNIDKVWRDDILPCRLYLRHWWVFDVQRYVTLNNMWGCFFRLLDNFVTDIREGLTFDHIGISLLYFPPVHATSKLGYVLSILSCIAHLWYWYLKAICISWKNDIIAFWQLKARYMSEAIGNHWFFIIVFIQ